MMADRNHYDDRSLEEGWLEEIASFERDLRQPQEPYKKRETERALSKWRRQLALWKRLYGETLGFRLFGSRDFFPVPQNWICWTRPKGPFPALEIDEFVEKELSKRKFYWGRKFYFDCPYWWIRWAIYQCLNEVDRNYYWLLETREISARLKRVSDLSDRAESLLLELAEALRDCGGIDLSRTEFEKSVLVPSEGSKTGFLRYTFDDFKLFDWTELEIPTAHLSLLSGAAEEIANKRQTKGRREDIRRRTFAISVGAMWWELTDHRPTSNSVAFADFLSAAEQVFFADEDTSSPTPECSERKIDRDVTRIANGAATLFRNIDDIEKHKVANRLDDIYLARLEAAHSIF